MPQDEGPRASHLILQPFPLRVQVRLLRVTTPANATAKSPAAAVNRGRVSQALRRTSAHCSYIKLSEGGSPLRVRVAALLLLVAGVCLTGPVAADAPTAILVSDSAMVPVRAVFEWLNATVTYAGGRITAARGTDTVCLAVGSRQASVNGQAVVLPTSPMLRGGTTYVPLRFVAESMGAGVSYDAAVSRVVVTDGDRSLTIPVSVHISRVYLSTIRCSVCSQKHGNVQVVLGDGRNIELTSDGNASAPKLGFDGLTVGWLQGKHELVQDLAQYVVHELVIYRNGHVVRKIYGDRGA